MASIRERSWGRGKTAYVVDYIDLDGKRRLQTFKSERAASAFKAAIEYAMRVEANVVSFKPPKPTPAETKYFADDLIWGAEEIADFLGLKRRIVYHYLTSGDLPAKKLGRTWVASKSRLRGIVT